MAKWADYVITCVSYTSDGTRISTVGVWTHEGDKLTNKQTWHRNQVVSALDEGKTFVTSVKNSEGLFTEGAAVMSRKVNDACFIQTVANNIAKDNLGNLPAC